MTKPRVNINPPADGRSSPNQKIIEVSLALSGIGCLVSFLDDGHGHLIVDVYRADEEVVVRHDQG